MIFSLLTDLKINLHKSTIIEVSRDLTTSAQITSDLGYRADNFPFVYLGIPLEVESLSAVAGSLWWTCLE